MILLLAGIIGWASAAAPSRIPTCDQVAADGWQADVGPQATGPERVGLFKNTAWLLLRLYKVGASKGDGDRCGMHPSCSAYTWQAVQADGPVLGGWLGAARIMADHRDPELRLCREGDRLLRVDLPAEGAFWRSPR